MDTSPRKPPAKTIRRPSDDAARKALADLLARLALQAAAEFEAAAQRLRKAVG